ncbi:MAG: PilT/PilU family type 4a pilus ATPase [Chloroflexi bacterium]|nr:PilT/PilU family type 4a pilus ATPase [Chloroflexota bacterium]
MDILALLKLAKSSKASDIHLAAGSAPLLRIDGILNPVADMAVLNPDDLRSCLHQLTTEKDRAEFDRTLELDFGYTLEDVGRFRCNVALQRGSIAMVIRLLPLAIATIEELNLPRVCKELAVRRRGMVVISGPTGSGKSTTLAAMIEHLNNTEKRRIVTIEDPVEYIYSNKKCAITQRELRADTLSFAEALRHVLRQDPDVILVGEMRDLETAAAALTIAETGHLVLTTGHASSAPGAIERIIDLFPTHDRPFAQSRLSTLLLGVLCQALVPRITGKGRIVAAEIMLANSAVRNLIREGKLYQLPNAIRTSNREGMQLLDQALVALYRDRTIDRDNLFSFANEPDQVAGLIEAEALVPQQALRRR